MPVHFTPSRRDRRSGRILAAVALALISVGAALFGACHAVKPRPNVVLISIDCLNERQFEQALARGDAPNLERLARRSVLFTRAYAHAPWTTPSHMSMLTGLYPREHGRDIPWRLQEETRDAYDRVPEHPTLATLLSAAGYETVAFVGTGSISARYGLARGFDLYHETARGSDGTDIVGGVLACHEWLRTRRNDRPFLLFFHTYDLHDPRAGDVASIDAAVSHVDRYIGALFDDLRDAGHLESPLILVTGDHGSEMRGTAERCSVHGAGHYDENLRVPLLVHMPGTIEAGRDDRLVRHIDILPTVAHAVGLALSRYRGRGLSLLDVRAGHAQPRFSFSEADARCVQRYGLASQRYKYIYTVYNQRQSLLLGDDRFVDSFCREPCLRVFPTEELYNLRTDPKEMQNLMTAPLAKRAAAALDAFRLAMATHLNLPPRYRIQLVLEKSAPPLSPELESGLRSLGYIE